ncbi:hypothetical protein PYCC9005_001238 [Savitreella phatthalungensis]
MHFSTIATSALCVLTSIAISSPVVSDSSNGLARARVIGTEKIELNLPPRELPDGRHWPGTHIILSPNEISISKYNNHIGPEFNVTGLADFLHAVMKEVRHIEHEWLGKTIEA